MHSTSAYDKNHGFLTFTASASYGQKLITNALGD